MNRSKSFVVAVGCLTMAFGAHARVVYDAGRSLLAHLETSEAANSAWTDAHGGQWACGSATDAAGTGWQPFASVAVGDCRGFGASATPWVMVNPVEAGTDVADVEGAGSNPHLDYGELYLHPGASVVTLLRFTVPATGWYSVHGIWRLMDARTKTNQNGVRIDVLKGGAVWFTTGCQSDAFEGVWRQTAEFQSGLCRLEQGTVLTFALGNNGHYAYDGTAATISVTKEDDEGVYDLSRDFLEQVNGEGAASAVCRGAGRGVWRFARATSVADAAECPLLDDAAKAAALDVAPPSAGGLAGLKTAEDPDGLPYLVVNPNVDCLTSDADYLTVGDTALAAGELLMHPGNTGKKDLVIRFSAPEAGFYRGRIYLRDVARAWLRGAMPANVDGVKATVLANRDVIAEAKFGYEEIRVNSATKHYVYLEIPSRLMTPGEWIDLVIDGGNHYGWCSTAIAATFWKDTDAPVVHDAGKALGGMLPGGAVVNPNGAWSYGTRGAVSGDGGFTPYSELVANYSGNAGLNAFGFSATGNDKLPWITVNDKSVPAAYNGIASLMMPYEIYSHPFDSASPYSCPVIRWTAPADGVYRAHGMVRDIDACGSNRAGINDGVVAHFVTANAVVDTKYASIDLNREAAGSPIKGLNVKSYEVRDAPYVYLRAGEWIDSVLSPNGYYGWDSTLMSFAVAAEDPFAGKDIVNIRFGAECAARPRIGWSDANRWNAALPKFRRGLWLADGTGRTNVEVELADGTEVSGEFATAGMEMPTGALVAADSTETKGFTLSGLKADEPYTVAIYSTTAAARMTTLRIALNGNGSAKETISAYGVMDNVCLFEVESDADGKIAVEFTSWSATAPAAVNALQVIGSFPAYGWAGTVIIVK